MEFSLQVDKYNVEHMDARIVLVEKYDWKKKIKMCRIEYRYDKIILIIARYYI